MEGSKVSKIFRFVFIILLLIFLIIPVAIAQDNDNNQNNDFNEDDLFNDEDDMVDEFDEEDLQDDITQIETTENEDTLIVSGEVCATITSIFGEAENVDDPFGNAFFVFPLEFAIYLDSQLDNLIFHIEFSFDYTPQYYNTLTSSWVSNKNVLDLEGYFNARIGLVKAYLDYEIEYIPKYYHIENDEWIADSTSYTINEMFLDISFNYNAFFRIGKQKIKWGTGYRWSPTDFINTERKDPLNPEEDERTGLNGLKMIIPISTFNIITFIGVDSLDSILYSSIVLRLEYAYDFFEISSTAYYEKDKRPMFGADFTFGQYFLGGLWDFWSEVSFSMGSNRLFVDFDESIAFPENKYYTYYADKDKAFFKTVVGFSYSKSDTPEWLADSITFSLEYYYNGDGYANADLYPYAILIAFMENVSVFEPFEMGMHYIGATLMFSELFSLDDTNFTTNYIINLSDLSSILTVSVKYLGIDDLSIEFYVNAAFGEEGTEFYFYSYYTRLAFIDNLSSNMDPITQEIIGYDGILRDLLTLGINLTFKF